jgi:hypothetical protein
MLIKIFKILAQVVCMEPTLTTVVAVNLLLVLNLISYVLVLAAHLKQNILMDI